MHGQTYYIKNMVCEHCAQVLQTELEGAGFEIHKLQLGELELKESLSDNEEELLYDLAKKNGFEIISDIGSRIVEQIKHEIINIIHSSKNLDSNLSEYLSGEIHKDYQYLSRLFSGVEGKSIERYYILQKIERAKELIVYGEQTLSEIAYQLGYSNAQHFSRQFKKETGLSPSHFKEVKENKRISIDRL